MRAVDRLLALVPSRRNERCGPLVDARPDPSPPIEVTKAPKATLQAPVPEHACGTWGELQSCIQRIKDDHETAARTHLSEISEATAEIARLKGAVDELLQFAFNQQGYLREWEGERSAKDRQIARLTMLLAQRSVAADPLALQPHVSHAEGRRTHQRSSVPEVLAAAA